MCRCLVALVVMIVTVTMFSIMMLYADLSSAELPIFQVHSGSLHSLEVTKTHFKAEFDILISASNPKKNTRFYYETGAVSAKVMFYMGEDEGVVLDSSTLPAFNWTGLLMFRISRSVNKNLDFSVAKNIAWNRHKHGTVEFGLIISGLFNFTDNIFHSQKSLEVLCNPLRFG